MKLSNIEGSPWNGFIWEKVDVEVIQHIRNHAFKTQINIPFAKCAVCTLIVIVYVDRADKTANFIKCEEHLMKHFVIKKLSWNLLMIRIVGLTLQTLQITMFSFLSMIEKYNFFW